MAQKGGKTILQRRELIRSNREQTDVLLVGAAGAGKSSLINSLITLIDHGETTHEASVTRYIPTAPEEHMGGHTLLREPVEITEYINVIDNRGWHDWDNEAAVKELIAQINGQRGFDDVDWEGNNDGAAFQGCDKVSCMCVVINGEGGTDSLLGFARLIHACYSSTGRRPLVVLTHKDKMTKEAIQAIGTHLQTAHGVTADRAFCVQNGDNYEFLTEESKLQLLDFLETCIADGISGRRFHRRKEMFNAKAEVRKKEQAEKESIQRKHQIQETIEEAAQEVELLKSVQEKHKIKRHEENEKVLIQITQDMKKEEYRKLEIITEKQAAIAKLEEKSKSEEISQKMENAKALAEIEKNTMMNESKKKKAMADLEKEQKIEEHQQKLEHEAALTELEKEMRKKNIEKQVAISILEKELKQGELKKHNVEFKKQETIAELETKMKEDEREQKKIKARTRQQIEDIERQIKEDEREKMQVELQTLEDSRETQKEKEEEEKKKTGNANSKRADTCQFNHTNDRG